MALHVCRRWAVRRSLATAESLQLNREHHEALASRALFLVMSAYKGEAEVIEKPRHFRF